MEEKKTKKKLSIKNIKHKKTAIFICIILFIIIFNVISGIVNPKKEEIKKPEIEAIEKRSLAKSISATGKIVANDKKDIITTLTGSKIKTVNVKEGDKVSVGDVICTFDTSDIADSLSKAQASLKVTKEQSSLGIQGAQRSLNDAIANRDAQINSSSKDLESAEKTYKDAEKRLNDAKSNLESLKKQKDELTEKYNIAKSEITKQNTNNEKNAAEINKLKSDLDSKKAVLDSLKSQVEKSKEDVKTSEETYNNAVANNTGTEEEIQNINNLKTKLDTEKVNLEKLNKDLEQKQNEIKQIESKINSASKANSNSSNIEAWNNTIKTYETLLSQITNLENSVNELQANLDNLYNVYDKTKIAHNSTVANANSTVASMQDNLKNSELSASVSTQAQETQIRTYKEQLADGVLVSTVNGVVTKINVKKGDIYTGSTIATIDGVDEFIIESEIDEYDIADIEVGMKVLIKTDSTRDEELEGTVIYTAPSATESALPSSTVAAVTNNATYTVKISLNTSNERLRLGMNAKLSIIIEEKEDVWTVPYNAIRERENGDKYIVINRKDSSEDEELDVSVGLEGSYYVEIVSDEIEDGMKVVLPMAESGNSVEALIELMGANGGM